MSDWLLAIADIKVRVTVRVSVMHDLHVGEVPSPPLPPIVVTPSPHSLPDE